MAKKARSQEKRKRYRTENRREENKKKRMLKRIHECEKVKAKNPNAEVENEIAFLTDKLKSGKKEKKKTSGT